METFGVLKRVVLVIVLLCASGFAHAAERLRIHGSNTLGARLVPALAEAWLRADSWERIERATPVANELTLYAQRGDERIEIELQAHGSGRGIDDLIGGTTDVAMASRAVSAEELARALLLGALDSPQQEAVVALDGVAVVVHPRNPLRALTLAQLRQVFDGTLRDWSALGAGHGPIALHARDTQSGTWETFRALVLDGGTLPAGARRYESSQQLAAAVAADPRAIGFVGVNAIGEARALALAEAGHALEPTPANVAVEDYVLSRRLYLYTPEQSTPLARAFVDFAQSAAGQQVVEHAGFVAQQVHAWPARVHVDAPPEYRALVGDARRLSVNFRFGAGSRLLDGKFRRDVARVAEFMRHPEQRGAPLLLLGFADASEVSPYLALTLSNDRVDLVARLLEAHGVAAHRSRGLGGALPVADNASAQGRLRNRRVEVWLGTPARDGAAQSSAEAAR